MSKQLDVLFVEPNSSQEAYQGLSDIFSAIETPTWSLLLAQSCRSQGYGVAILDCAAERLSASQSVLRIKDANPRLVVFVMYGQNPNSGTTSMIGANKTAKMLKDLFPTYPICFVGSHVSALPKEVLNYPWVDLVLQNEGVYALWNLLKITNFFDIHQLQKIKGIGYKADYKYGLAAEDIKKIAVLNPPERIVPQNRMDIDLPGYAWDLLPYNQKPLDLYRSHFWHSNFDHAKRSPFAAIYTSLGCKFACNFCMINIVNRVDNADGVIASDSKGMRYWSPQFILREFEKLNDIGAVTVRISDEMFFLNKKYFEPLLQGIIEKQLKLNMWAYSRVDTVQKQYLELFKKAGIEWLALGIEAANQTTRLEISKGTFKNVNIEEVVKTIQSADINIISNYMFGLPNDTLPIMQETLDFAIRLNTEMISMLPCQALPGTQLYYDAQRKGTLPTNLQGYAFLSYESEPLPTNFLSSAEVLSFRDRAWNTYMSHPDYLSLVEKKFGSIALQNIHLLKNIKLKRKILGD